MDPQVLVLWLVVGWFANGDMGGKHFATQAECEASRAAALKSEAVTAMSQCVELRGVLKPAPRPEPDTMTPKDDTRLSPKQCDCGGCLQT